MAKRAESNLIIFVLVAILLCLAGVGIYFTWQPTITIPEPNMTFSVNGKNVSSGHSLGALTGAETFKVNSTDYTVTITAYTSETTDFTFDVGTVKTDWSELAGEDLTAFFKIQKTDSLLESEFTLTMPDLKDLLQKRSGTVVELNEEPLGDIFKMTVEGKEKMEFTFGFKSAMTITLSPGEIIF